MQETKHKNFHTIRKLKARGSETFILEEWKPERDLFIIGIQIGLLCERSDHYEIYLSVSRNPSLKPKGFFVGLKTDYLFYAQRDVYSLSTGPQDLTKEIFLPAGQGFLIKKGQPVYVKIGADNATAVDLHYDAFCNIYYIEE